MHRSTSARIIYYPQNWCLELSDIFKFWEISDNISLTVQDRDIVAMEDQ